MTRLQIRAPVPVRKRPHIPPPSLASTTQQTKQKTNVEVLIHRLSPVKALTFDAFEHFKFKHSPSEVIQDISDFELDLSGCFCNT